MNFTMNPSDVVCIDRIHIFIRQIDTMNNIREEDIDKTSEDYLINFLLSFNYPIFIGNREDS